MKLRRSVKFIEGKIDVAPLVDIIFLLLIFFILTSLFVFQPGIKVEPPRGLSGVGGVNLRYIVAISPQEPPIVFFNDQVIDRAQLSAQLRQIAQSEPNASIVLKADNGVAYGLAVEIMNEIVNNGLSVVLATQDEVPAATP